MKLSKSSRQTSLKETIEETPFITDHQLAEKYDVSIQTIRLDRMELAIPELRKRIKTVATTKWKETLKSLPIEEVIGDIVDLELDERAISILDIKSNHVFSRNRIARGHHIFAQANSLAVAVINDDLGLTARSEIRFKRQVKESERVIAKAFVEGVNEHQHTVVRVESYVAQELVFTGIFEMFRSKEGRGE